MPPTDENGVSSVTIDKTQDVVYLKEITSPVGYLVDATAHDVTLVMGSKVTMELLDDEKKASLTVYKEGEVLTGADVTDEKVTFRYETRRQKGAYIMSMQERTLWLQMDLLFIRMVPL